MDTEVYRDEIKLCLRFALEIVQQNGTKDIDEVQQNFDNSESKGQIY